MKYRILSTLLCVCMLTGCIPIRYSKYTGHDDSSYQGTWPQGPGTMVESRFAVPVYRGWPEKPYQVLGSVSFPDPNKNWVQDEGIISVAASEAKKHNADAIIIRAGAEMGVSAIAGADSASLVGSSYQTTALAIRWVTAGEIAQWQDLIDGFIKRLTFRQRLYPSAPIQPVAELVIKSLGYDPNSKDLFNSFNERMEKLVSDKPDDLTGEWIFKATDSRSNALSESGDHILIGLAMVSCDGQTIVIVSSAGPEMNFSGTISKGSVRGNIGVDQISTKCEGVATDDKISINFQSLTPDGTARGNVILHRLLLKPQ